MSNIITRIKTLLVGAALVAPLMFVSAARATVTQRDVLIKGQGSDAAVYYLAADGKRYVFPNQKTYNTWFTNFGSVVTVSMADLISFPLGGNVTYRPGIRLVKVTTDPKVYAVDVGGTLRWVTSESLAAALYGSDWSKKIDDVPDAFFTNYRVGADVHGTSDYSPFSAASSATTINTDREIPLSADTLRADTTPEAPEHGAQSPVVPPSATECSSDVWTCSAWSSCDSSDSQTRTCSLTTDCPNLSSASPALTQSCSISFDASSDAGSVAAGSDSVLAKFRIGASDEDLRLTKASFSVESPTAVMSLRLYDGSTPVAEASSVNSNGDAFFSSVDFVIPRNTAKDLTVRGIINTVGPTGVASGANAKVTIRDTGGQYVFEMRGAQLTSQTVLTSLPGGDRSGNDKIVRKTVPNISVAALPTTLLTAGDIIASRINIGASSSGDLALKTLTVDIQKPNNAAVDVTGNGTHSTIRVGGNATNIAGTSSASSGCLAGGGTFCQIRTQFSDEAEIAAGSTNTYDVRLHVSGTLQTGDSLSTVFDADTQVLNGVLTSGSSTDQVKVGGTDVDFAWSDMSASSHTSGVGSSSADWASGAYIKTLPTDVQVLVK